MKKNIYFLMLILLIIISLACSLKKSSKNNQNPVINSSPKVNIILPVNETNYLIGDTTSYKWKATAQDPEDGALQGVWYINEKILSSGNNIIVKPSDLLLSQGKYAVIFKAHDKKGLYDSSLININIAISIPEVKITLPINGSVFLKNTKINLTGYGQDALEGKLFDTSLKWFSNKNGFLGFDTSLEISSLTVGSHIITLTATNKQSIKNTDVKNIIINETPQVKIITQVNKYYAQNLEIPLEAEGFDSEDDLLSYSWTINNEEDKISGKTIYLKNLPLGLNKVKVKVTDRYGLNNFDSTSFTIKDTLKFPNVSIISPIKQKFMITKTIVLEAIGSDEEDGDLPDDYYVWHSKHSNIDEVLGTGKKISWIPNQKDNYNITISLHDKDNMFSYKSINISIIDYNEAPQAKIILPKINTSVKLGRNIYFTGEGTDFEDGSIPENSFIWKSNIDGIIGNKKTFILKNLSTGTHSITLVVNDSMDYYNSTSVDLIIEPSSWKLWTNGNVINTMLNTGSTLWAGTKGGLVKWDTTNKNNVKFTTIDGLINNNVTALAYEADSHSLWIGTSSGLCNLNDTTYIFEYYTAATPNTLIDNSISALVLDKNNNLWIGTESGISKFNLTTKTWESFDDFGSITSLAVDNDNELWAGTSYDGVYRRSNNLWIHYSYAYNKLIDNSITTFAIDIDNNIWIGTNYGVSKYNKKDEIWKNYDDNLLNYYVNSILINKNETVLIGTPMGISKYNISQDKWENMELSSLNNSLTCLLEDSENNIYIGTNDGVSGICMKNINNLSDNNSWEKFIINEDKIKNNSIEAIAKDKNGYIWLGYGNLGSGTDKLINSTWENHANLQPDYYLFNNVNTIYINKTSGNPWLGTEGGVYLPVENIYDSLSNISSIAENNAGEIWAGTSLGDIFSLKNSWQFYLNTNNITNVLFDTSDNLWVGYDYNNYAMASYKISNNILELTNSYAVSGKKVKSLMLDNTNRLCIATENGIDRFENDAWSNLLAINSFTNVNVITTMSYDKTNNIFWIGTNNGLYKYNSNSSALTSYTVIDGLADPYIRTIFIDNDGNKWIGTSSGLSMYNEN